MKSLQIPTLVVGVLISMLGGQSAQALDFSFGFSPDLSSDMRDGLNLASERWESILTDDVTVAVDVSVDPDLTMLASFRSSRVNVSYQNFVAALGNDSSRSPDDETALEFLPESNDFDLLANAEFDLLINGTRNHPSGTAGDLTPYVDADGDCNNRLIRISAANAKAIGLPRNGTNSCAGSPQSVTSDGRLAFNPNIMWDFDPSDGIAAGHYDFVGAATQGLGVVLGFGSGVDVLDFNTSLPDPADPDGNNVVAFDDNILAFVNPTDLFRFSEDSLTLAAGNGSQSLIDWTTGRTDSQGQEVDKYFSIDGGQTKIASFSTGRKFGDGYQASNWKADNLTGTYLGIFEPSPEPGQVLFITENDRRILDVIGWDLDPGFWSSNSGSGGNPPPSGGNPPPVAVPEPSNALGMLALFAIACGYWAVGKSRQ
ncbi:MAG: hypothetical protein F6K30_08105 [Cyanothece sp. SIO2G6]|nr:hypothetical protein [Cyanothece sp. SIO2G6]